MGQDNVTFLAQSGKAKGHLVLNGPGQWAHAGWCWCFMNFVKFLRNIVLAHCFEWARTMGTGWLVLMFHEFC